MSWIVTLEPIISGEVCKIEIESNLDIIVLDDIHFGDVWFCSGQSNMGWAMLGIQKVVPISAVAYLERCNETPGQSHIRYQAYLKGVITCTAKSDQTLFFVSFSVGSLHSETHSTLGSCSCRLY